MILYRRYSLVFKILLLVPVYWILVFLLYIITEKFSLEKERLEVINSHLESNNIIDDTEGNKLEGRKPRQSTEDIKVQKVNQNNAEGGVLPDPRYPVGFGELGKPVKLSNLTEEQQKSVKQGWEKSALNQYASDLISLYRSLPDARARGCEDLKYSDDLPPTSVIICFHNEAWSVLLRTVHSVLDRSPTHLIHEVILVDDFSNMPHLGRQLDEYVSRMPKVRVVRARKREGLIRAKLLGFSVATAPILTYLDSHCECTSGWLEPLLQRIANNWTTVVCPVIDFINYDTFEYWFLDVEKTLVGGFHWNLMYDWHVIPEREKNRRNHSWDPIRSPTMAGGLFSIDKRFFERLGTYDSGFDIWGGENLELSFKTWMCGGTLEILPCSHVGHVFRKRKNYGWTENGNTMRKNSVRLAEVWLDDHKKYYYGKIGNKLGDFGDIQPRKDLRKKLQCKSFDWYLKNVYPELFNPEEAVAFGEVRNLGAGGDTCLDSLSKPDNQRNHVGVYRCHGQGGSQYWILSKEGEIRREDSCLDFSGKYFNIHPCLGARGNQLWIYNLETMHIQHGNRQCLEITTDKRHLVMSKCNNSERQKWRFQNYNASKFKSL